MDEWEIRTAEPEGDWNPGFRPPRVTLNGEPFGVSAVAYVRVTGKPTLVWIDDVPVTGHCKIWRGDVLVVDVIIRPEYYADSETADMRFRSER